MDDDLDPKDKELEDVDEGEVDEFDDDLLLGNKKPKKKVGDDDPESLDVLAEEEDGILPEDSFDDQDLW